MRKLERKVDKQVLTNVPANTGAGNDRGIARRNGVAAESAECNLLIAAEETAGFLEKVATLEPAKHK